jgi:hypothetical protein
MQDWQLVGGHGARGNEVSTILSLESMIMQREKLLIVLGQLKCSLTSQKL